MAGEWKDATLGDLIDAGDAHLQTGPFGTALKAAEYSAAGVPLISVGEVRQGHFEVSDKTPRVSIETTNRLPKFVLNTGDIVFGRKGGIDRNAIVHPQQQGWFLGSDGIRLRLSGKYSSLFFSFQMRSPATRAWLLQNCEGTTLPSLNQEILGRVPIVIPPLAEQEAIAAVLGALDDKIDLNRRMNATLEAMARALFQSWFVDFDPVRAKLDGRQPAGMDAATAALFPKRFDESIEGRIPSGWRRLALREVAELSSGGTPSKGNPAYWNGDIPWVSPKAMSGIHVGEVEARVSEEAVGNGTRRVPSGAVLVMVRGMGLHQGVRISQAQRDVTFNQDVRAVVPTTGLEMIVFWGLLHVAGDLLSKVHASGHGTGVLATEFLEKVTFMVPPPEVTARLVKPLADINSRIASNEAASRTLAALRDTLLPKLLSGELRIKDAERFVGRIV